MALTAFSTVVTLTPFKILSSDIFASFLVVALKCSWLKIICSQAGHIEEKRQKILQWVSALRT
jgi:hypothetical protein